MAIRDLRGKQVVVTGAASGIGRATAIAFAREGANIVAADLDEAALAGLKSEIEALGVSCASTCRMKPRWAALPKPYSNPSVPPTYW